MHYFMYLIKEIAFYCGRKEIFIILVQDFDEIIVIYIQTTSLSIFLLILMQSFSKIFYFSKDLSRNGLLKTIIFFIFIMILIDPASFKRFTNLLITVIRYTFNTPKDYKKLDKTF